MKKLYFLKMLFALSLRVSVSQLASGQKKKILYVGADSYYAVIRSADKQMVDSLVYWGYDTAYMAMAVYDAGGGVDGGGIVVHDIADVTDNQVKITDNKHYITQIFDKDEIVTWSSSTAFAQVPYIQGVLYVKNMLAIPVAAYTPPTNGETVMAMAMIENKFPK